MVIDLQVEFQLVKWVMPPLTIQFSLPDLAGCTPLVVGPKSLLASKWCFCPGGGYSEPQHKVRTFLWRNISLSESSNFR